MATSKTQAVKATEIEKTILPGQQALKYEEVHFIDTQKPVWNYSLLPKKISSILETALFIMAIKNLAVILQRC